MKKEILVVDDSYTTLILLEWFLKENGYNVSIVIDVEKALEYLEKQTPDLILLDIQMPKISGYDFLKILREAKKDIPILIISANDSSEAIKIVKDLGVSGFVAKPFKLNELLIKVEGLINYRKK
jgi:DNA-binding response OmpR family regulator